MAKKKIQLEAKVDQILNKIDTMDQKFDSMDKRIDHVLVYVQEEFDTVHQRFDSMLSKKEFYEWTYRYDDLLQEMRDARQNRLLFEKQFVDLDDTVAQHENRIKKLEHKAKA